MPAGCVLLRRHVCGSDKVVSGPQLEHAVADGYDVRGLMYWTLVDNFEVTFHQCLSC